MREFVRTIDNVAAAALESALSSAGIRSQITNEPGNALLGTVYYVIWIPEDADNIAALNAFKHVKNSYDRKLALSASRVSVSEEQTICKKCRYDLRGQTTDGNCPECGYPYFLIPEQRCPHCDATSPADFLLCWRCGQAFEEIPPSEDPEKDASPAE